MDPIPLACFERGTEVRMVVRKSLAERFWPKVEQGSGDACWVWRGSKTQQGYGLIRAGRTTRRAHVVSWELKHEKPFPLGKIGMHSCDNPSCVNPCHIIPGTLRENSADMVRKRRHVDENGKRPWGIRLKVGGTCRNGHVLRKESLVPRQRGTACAECLKDQWKRARVSAKLRRAAS